MKTLVTGGSGYLGTYVRNFFEAKDFSRRSSLNILEPADAQIVENYDVVIHLAGHLDKNPEGAEECFRTNADGTRNIIRNMRPGSVFIYASTKDVYGTQASEYEFVPEEWHQSHCSRAATLAKAGIPVKRTSTEPRGK